MSVARLCLASAILLLPTVLSAAPQHSMEDQLACTPDVYRLCASQIPDEDAIVICLRQNKAALSSACRKVFSDPAHAGNGTSNDDAE